jgi:hypothetical protein
VVRGANAPDAMPSHERRLDAEITERYGPGRPLAEVSQAWRPYRTWAAVHLRALREQRQAFCVAPWHLPALAVACRHPHGRTWSSRTAL